MRSRGISVVIIFQSIAQLKNRYTNDVWQEILGNCDTKLIFGCNEIMTAQYVSDLLGVSTIEMNTIRKEAGFDGKFTLGNESSSTVKRNLINPDELIKFDNTKLIAIVRGEKPLICNKYDYSEHSLSKEIEEIVIEEYKSKLQLVNEQKTEKIEVKLPTFEEFLKEEKF